MKYALPLILLPGLWLTACGDYYGTTYRYPQTRTHTESHVYRYTVPSRVYPVTPPARPSIHQEYEINQHYYGYPVSPGTDRSRFRDHEHEHEHDDHQYQRDGKPDAYRPPFREHDDHQYQRNARPDADRPRFRPIAPEHEPSGRTYGQQEFDKKMEQLRQNPQNATRMQPQPEPNHDSPLERIRQRREQKMDIQQTPERIEKARPNPLVKKKRQDNNPTESSE